MCTRDACTTIHDGLFVVQPSRLHAVAGDKSWRNVVSLEAQIQREIVETAAVAASAADVIGAAVGCR